MITTKLSKTFLMSLICIFFSSVVYAQNNECPIPLNQSINSDGTMNELNLPCTVDWAWHLEDMANRNFKIIACSGGMGSNEQLDCETIKLSIDLIALYNLDCARLFDNVNVFYIDQQVFTEVLEGSSNNDGLGAKGNDNRIVSEGFAVIDDISILLDLSGWNLNAKKAPEEYDYYFLYTNCSDAVLKPDQHEIDIDNSEEFENVDKRRMKFYSIPIEENNTIEFNKTLNIPNPLPDRASCAIFYNVPVANEVIIINVFNVNGELIDRLLQPTTHYSGIHVINWSIDHLAKGIYFVRLQSPYREVTEKVVKVR